MRFNRDGRVEVKSLVMNEQMRQKLSRNLMLFFTNVTRKAESVLGEQLSKLNGNLEILRELKRLALLGQEALQAGEFDEFGTLLHQGWELKKSLASRITNPSIDALYESARKAGALGGKITGAGGGGFLLIYCPLDRQEDVRKALRDLPELPFKLERDGTKVIFNYRRY
jgi:D-glycero-alpha-D-manno-heptose-7-phosphate kinase